MKKQRNTDLIKSKGCKSRLDGFWYEPVEMHSRHPLINWWGSSDIEPMF